METFLHVIGIVLLALGCVTGVAALIFGLPGTFIIFFVALVYAWATSFVVIQWSTLAWLLGLALVGEVLEVMLAARTGGSRPSVRVALGAIIGGVLGGIIGAPLFFGLGALPGALFGAFGGAAVAVASEGGATGEAMKAGMAAMRGRFLGFILKISIATVMVVLIGIALVQP